MLEPGAMSDVYENALWLIAAIRQGLEARRGEGVDDVLARLAEQELGRKDFAPPLPARLPVLRHLPDCIGQTMLLDAGLAAAIAAIEDDLSWQQSASYSDAVLGDGFTENYGWAELIGSMGFFPGEDFRLGLLMLGSGRHYKDHYHPAPELYWPLTGPSDWKAGAGGFVTRAAGETIWHIPWKVHATVTDKEPLLAVWAWTRDVATPARLVGA